MADARIVLTAHRLVRAVNTVQLVSDIERVEQLVVAAARRVLAGRAHLPVELRPDVATLGRAGARRLRDLADHARHDTAYLACGRELRELHQNLARHARAPRRSDEVAGLCAALTTGVLEASRHAARAA